MVTEELQETLSNVPCGVCVYRVDRTGISPVYHNPAFYEIVGYSEEHIREVERETRYLGVHADDIVILQEKVEKAIHENGSLRYTYRLWNDREMAYRWIRLEGKVKPQGDGSKLLYGVYSDVSEQLRLDRELKEANDRIQNIINTMPGGVASYRVEGGKFIPTYYSDGVMKLSGHTREEFMELTRGDALNVICEPDRQRVTVAAGAALASGEVLDVSYRMKHKDGSIIWIHLNGRRVGPLTEPAEFYAVFTGISSETRLYQSIANESADGIYVIDKENYDLLYINESRELFSGGKSCLGQKCYTALHGKDHPCEFCTLHSHKSDGEEHEMAIAGAGRFYSTRFRETDWNGVPAYIKYIRDITESVKTRKEKERLEEYFETVVRNLPDGIAVIRYEEDGSMTPEYISDGFAALTGMSPEDAWKLYGSDAVRGAHPDDLGYIKEQLSALMAGGIDHHEMSYRLKKGVDGYVWVRVSFSVIQNQMGEKRLYAVYRDITAEKEEREQVRRRYNELIIQHYRAPGPNALIIGHCNITRNRIIEIIDYTNSDPLNTFGSVREEFFMGIAGMIVEPGERREFLDTYLGAPALAAFRRNETEKVMECFIRLPGEELGRYVRFKMNMVVSPDNEDVTGILTVTDITEQIVAGRILHQLSVTGYDFVVDVDLTRDHYSILSCNENACCIPPREGCHTKWMDGMLKSRIVPRDREQYKNCLDPELMVSRLRKSGPYTFAFSMSDDNGDIRTKNMTVSAVDLRLGRVCLLRTDITESVREQQGLLNMIAYTFDLACFIDVGTKKMTMYTRQTVLENLPPYQITDYQEAIGRFISQYGTGTADDPAGRLRLPAILDRLEEFPGGYEFILPYRAEQELRYKQVNVLWGDQNHRTVCLVRADVTDMLAAERRSQTELENALELAKKADRAKSSFLSTMSHDIRTPMNAIMGMTALASAHPDDQERVKDCLKKITVSSRHLLSLINDVLDMSKIDGSKIKLNRMNISLLELQEQISAMLIPPASASGLQFVTRMGNITHTCFYGDSLRINQILINLLSNAVKFTPEGGKVEFLVEEIQAEKEGYVRYRFTVRDTGIGIAEDSLPSIFEPFVRSDNAEQIEGTGLGLSIAKGLVDLMDGKISVQSSIGQGTVFLVELECEAADETEKPESSSGDSGTDSEEQDILAGRRILVAEDNAINAEIICGLLDMFGAESVVVKDGKQAVEEFSGTAPGTYDAVLMDIQMPQMNGYEATKAIRSLGRADAGEIPVIAMTANAFAEDVQSAIEAGMTAHVAKPIDVGILKTTLYQTIKCGVYHSDSRE